MHISLKKLSRFFKNGSSVFYLLLLIIHTPPTDAQQTQANVPIRYQDLVFDSIEIHRDIPYGSNKTQAGTFRNLLMDIYVPSDDTAKYRPIIILAHGGYYLNGSKENFSRDCMELAKAGYTAVSINYRLIDVPESPAVYKRATADAVNDTKAAVRFFRRDFERQNLFHVDTANIFIGGYSAGAITSLHYAYANTPADVYSIGGHLLVLYMTIHGGNAGDSGNPGYSSHVRGVLNLAGSIHLANMIDADEPVLFSVHGTEDQIVPFKAGKSGYSWVRTEGSGLVHARADEVGLLNQIHAIPNAGHAAYFYCESCPQEMRNFIVKNLKR